MIEIVTNVETGEVTEVPYTPGPLPVPTEVTPLQMRKALRQLGIKDAAEAYATSLSEEEREAWEYATMIEKDNAFIKSAQTALGMTQEEADDLFRLASTL